METGNGSLARRERVPRFLLLACVVVDLALIALHVALYPELLAQPGGALYIAEPVTLLVVYVGIGLWLTAMSRAGARTALRIGVGFGLMTGAMEVVNLTLETFTDLSGAASILATAPFLLGAFALWGVASGVAASRTRSLGRGVLASVWSAMTCMLIAIAFGLLLGLTSLGRLEHILATDPDFRRSHWHDLHAFAIANQLDAAFSHLLGALIVGAIVGVLGASAGLAARWMSSRAAAA